MRSKEKSPYTLPHKAINLVNVANINKLHDKNRSSAILDPPLIWKQKKTDVIRLVCEKMALEACGDIPVYPL
jgi:hypothetical protein